MERDANHIPRPKKDSSITSQSIVIIPEYFQSPHVSLIRVINLVAFTFGFMIMYLFPLLLPLVEIFTIREHGQQYFDENKGALLQGLGSSWYLANMIGSFAWAKASDRFGRRPIVLLSLSGITVAALCFAYSTTYLQFILSQSLNGLFDCTFFSCENISR